jgi:hypothetical protein
MGKKSPPDPGSGKYGMNITDLIFEKLDADPDPGTGTMSTVDPPRDGKSRTRDPGSGINLPDPQHRFYILFGQDSIRNNSSGSTAGFVLIMNKQFRIFFSFKIIHY